MPRSKNERSVIGAKAPTSFCPKMVINPTLKLSIKKGHFSIIRRKIPRTFVARFNGKKSNINKTTGIVTAIGLAIKANMEKIGDLITFDGVAKTRTEYIVYKVDEKTTKHVKVDN